jgi:peptidoglycan/LPS O-acetylase OafA/YrhL
LRVYNSYIIALILAFGAINAIFAAAGQKKLDAYFIANFVACLIISLLYVYFNPRARRLLSALGVALFGGFMVIVAIKVMEVVA